MAEQNIVERTRQLLVSKGYPDPANCSKPDSNNTVVYAQDDYKLNSELKELLAHASKSNGKNKDILLWTEQADVGRPEFVIINHNENLAIVIECKAAAKQHNLISSSLKNDNRLVQKASIISKYAVDGALHYAKFLSKKYNVIAIGISGIEHSDSLQVSTYYWEKDKELFYDVEQKSDVDSTTPNNETRYCFGPFISLKLDSLQSFDFYKHFIANDVKNIIKEFNEEKAMLSATELNVMLDGAGVNPTMRALLISGLLLALRDKTFQKTYEDREITSTDLQKNLQFAIERVIDSENIEDDFKKKVLKGKFNDAFNQQDLLDDNASKLRCVLEKLHTSVFPYMTGDYSVDVIGKFYHEFLSYAKNGHNSGIKLTPPQTTELFCDLAELKVTDIVLDPCLGTGGFLIAAMNRLYKLADSMDETAIDNYFKDKLSDNEISDKEVSKLKASNKNLYGYSNLTISDVKAQIRKNQLVGCENDNIMYTLGCSNMILRGDGKSNIQLGDAFKREEELISFKANVGFVNPPYSESEYSTMEFAEFLCRVLKKGSKAVVIVPTSAVHSDDYLVTRNKILKHNKLLGVMSMSPDLFKGIADTITCILVLETGTPHNYDDSVYFGNWKEDGYYWHKILGMIPDHNMTRFSKTPEMYKDGWLKSFRNKNIDDEYGVWKKLNKTVNKDGSIECRDEWLWEYFVETDYSVLTKDVFESEIKSFMMYQLKQLNISELAELEQDTQEDIE